MDLSFEFTSVVMLTLIFWPHFLSKAERSNPIIMRMIKPLRLFYLYIKMKENTKVFINRGREIYMAEYSV